MNLFYTCDNCSKKHPINTLEFRCECGGLFNLNTDYEHFNFEDIHNNNWSLFRYLDVLPFDNNSKEYKNISMGEGMTGISNLSHNLANVFLKMEYMMPTLSFKDRGAAVLISKAKEIGVKKVVQDSSGNAGVAVAAYSSRANIECEIFVPSSTPYKKVEQIRGHGAKVTLIEGSREKTAEAALNAAQEKDVFYASHVYNPLFYQGTKTYIYEVFEQFNKSLPDILFVPVGNGTLLLGCYFGLLELKKFNLIDKFPKVIAIQSENCCPIYHAFINTLSKVDEVETSKTLADGIAIAKPMRGNLILKAIKELDGEIILAPENKILKAKESLLLNGFYVEPTTAATFAGFEKYAEENSLKNKNVLIPLCGSGAKS